MGHLDVSHYAKKTDLDIHVNEQTSNAYKYHFPGARENRRIYAQSIENTTPSSSQDRANYSGNELTKVPFSRSPSLTTSHRTCTLQRATHQTEARSFGRTERPSLRLLYPKASYYSFLPLK